jgi:glycosyltransferase involved in cell wall biosynthesis
MVSAPVMPENHYSRRAVHMDNFRYNRWCNMNPIKELPERPKLMVLSPERILPPEYGGALRSANLIVGLSQAFETLVIVPQRQQEIEEASYSHPELNVAKWISSVDYLPERPLSIYEKVARRLDLRHERRLRQRWDGVCRDWFFGPLRSWNWVLRRMVAEFEPDVVMMEHSRHAAGLDFIRRLRPGIFRVINSQNVESDLVRQLLPESLSQSDRNKIVSEIEKFERSMTHRCDLLWSCSADDQERYRKIGVSCKHWGVVPNGVDVNATVYWDDRRADGPPKILFAGTLCYEPNIWGIHWFNQNVWPLLKYHLPDIRWHIVGRAPSDCVRRIAEQDASIELFSDVPSMVPFLRDATVGICPLFSGSGTRLKILEAFSAGLPMVATRFGAEGIDATSEEHLLLRDTPAEFARAIVDLIQNSDQAQRLSINARQLAVTRYKWSAIAESAGRQLRMLVEQSKGDR